MNSAQLGKKADAILRKSGHTSVSLDVCLHILHSLNMIWWIVGMESVALGARRPRKHGADLSFAISHSILLLEQG